jgi:hypothetical protein
MAPAAIRLLGGGATQFSIAGGNPEATVKQTDVSFYLQDEWKLRPNLTISPGLRYENQNNIDSNFNFAPRIAFAWSPVFGGRKPKPEAANPAATPSTANASAPAATPAPAPAPPGPPKMVFRAGLGYFYNRVSDNLTLNANRFDGVNQQQFLVTNPLVLDLFPLIPPVDALQEFSQPQVRRILSDDMATSRSLRFMFTAERQLPAKIKLSVGYSFSRTDRLLRIVNINAPLGGTFIPGVPDSGVRPLGADAGNVLEYQSNGRSLGANLNVNVNGMVKKINFWGGYNLNKTRNTDNGASGSPFDAYDFSDEYARTPWGTLNFFYAGGNYQAPHGINFSVFSIGASGSTFNITTGRDTNGDTFFTERPAFATDLNEPGVIVTPLGAFDPTPSPGQTIIPRNFGRGPGYVTLNVNMSKTIKFGKVIPPQTPPPGTARTTDAGSTTQQPASRPPVQRPYSLVFSINTINLLNRTNKGNPVGNMTSPFFLQSPSGSNNFFFSPGGGSGGNRLISLRVRLSF